MGETYLVKAQELLARIKRELDHSKTVTYQTEMELRSFLEDTNLKGVVDGILNPAQPEEASQAEEPSAGPVESGAEGANDANAAPEGSDLHDPEVQGSAVDGPRNEEAN